MIAFGFGFSIWVVAITLVNHEQDNLTKDSPWGLVLFMAICTAYVFWAIGWALAWVANLVQCHI